MLGISTRARCTDQGVRRLLGLYALGRLADDDRERTARHVTLCPHCAQESADLRGVTVLLDLLSAADVADIVAGKASEQSARRAVKPV